MVSPANRRLCSNVQTHDARVLLPHLVKPKALFLVAEHRDFMSQLKSERKAVSREAVYLDT